MSHITRAAFGAATAALSVAAVITPPAAQAAAPTRIADTFRDLVCAGTSPTGEDVVIGAYDSLLEGSSSRAQVATATGERVGRGEGGSDWGPGSVRASLEVLDDDGASVGTAYLAVSFTVDANGERVVNRFKDGNIRVVEDNTSSALTITDVTMSFRGAELTDVRCEGNQLVGSLFFTNPRAYVARGGYLAVDSCALRNAEGFDIEGDLDGLAVSFTYADRPDVSAFSNEIVFTDGRWEGTFGTVTEDGEVQRVAASATLTQSGPTYRSRTSTGEGTERLRITPYTLSFSAAGPNAPASITCQVLDVETRLHVLRSAQAGG